MDQSEQLDKEVVVVQPELHDTSETTEISVVGSEIKPEVAPTAIEIQGEGPQATVTQVADEPIAPNIKQEVGQLKTFDEQHQLQVLTDLAFNKNLGYAISVARGLDNPHILDAFHDALIDQLREQLIKQEKLERL